MQKKQYNFFKKCISDWPLQRHIIRKARDVKSTFITYYTKLIDDYDSAAEILERSMQYMKEEVESKAQQGKSRYVTYLQLNPSLSRPSIYDIYIPTYKLQNISNI